MKRFAFLFIACLTLGAGCAWFADPSAPQTPTPSAIDAAFDTSSSTFGAAATSSANGVVEPRAWDVTEVYSKHVVFDAPSGYWVYQSSAETNYWFIKGSAPAKGGEDPGTKIRDTRKAVMNGVMFNNADFPTWDRFKVTMAQFNCMEGSTDQDLVGCLDKPLNVQKGKTEGGYNYELFSLAAVRKIDQHPEGTRTFIMVGGGGDNPNGILLTLVDQSAVGAALELVKSMRASDAAN